MKTIDLAKDIIYLCTQYNIPFNHTKVQNLLYFFVGFALINNVEPQERIQNEDGEEELAIIDELPKAWPYGPVFPKVHKNYNEIIKIPADYQVSIKDPNAINILDKTITQWGILSATRLSEWSHEENSPWDLVVRQQGSGWNTIIPLGLIREYFENEIINVVEMEHLNVNHERKKLNKKDTFKFFLNVSNVSRINAKKMLLREQAPSSFTSQSRPSS